MSDKELLELAAKAAGIDAQWDCPERGMVVLDKDGTDTVTWNPLTDDGDALQLAVKLNLVVLPDASGISTCSGQKHRAKELHGADPYSATRRAITRAAAEIGKGLP